jgi:hypothetical protein
MDTVADPHSQPQVDREGGVHDEAMRALGLAPEHHTRRPYVEKRGKALRGLKLSLPEALTKTGMG